MGSNPTGLPGIAARTSLLEVQQDQVLQHLHVRKSLQDDARIEKGAKQFEAMLLGSWLEQAQQSFATVPGADADEDQASGRDQMMSLGVHSLAQAMADSGGIGIGKMIARSLEAAATRAEAGSAAAGRNAEET